MALTLKHKIFKAKSFSGCLHVKELDNFPWDMRCYFVATRMLEEEQVIAFSLFLTSYIKLLWCTWLKDDMSAGKSHIRTWDVIRKELNNQCARICGVVQFIDFGPKKHVGE